MCKSRSCVSQMSSLAVATIALYLTSIEDRDTICLFLNLHDIIESSRKMKKLVVIFLYINKIPNQHHKRCKVEKNSYLEGERLGQEFL